MGRRSQSALFTLALLIALAALASHVDLVRRLAKEYATFLREQAAALAADAERGGAPVPPQEALELLKQGNQRYMKGQSSQRAQAMNPRALRVSLAERGERPMAAVVGCADSQAPVEQIFDARPGDLYVARNAGSSCGSADSSLVASAEYAVASLDAKLLVVMGNTDCGAMIAATRKMMEDVGTGSRRRPLASALDLYLDGFKDTSRQALAQMCQDGLVEDIAAVATRLNVFSTIRKLVEFSDPIRDKVATGEVEVHGAMYNTASGMVEWLGQHPKIFEIATPAIGPPSA